MTKLTEALTDLFKITAEAFQGASRRLFMGRVVSMLGHGGAQYAEKGLGWNRGTIRKGLHELQSGLRCVDAYSSRGRKRAEEHLPNLLQDIRAIADSQSQTDPSFKSTRLYTRLTAAEVRRQLIEQKGYRDEAVPTSQTIGGKLNRLGYHLRKVRKTKPKKKIAETDAIFDELRRVNAAADAAQDTLRISLDTKAVVKVGEFSRGGQSRVEVNAADHDFRAEEVMTPFGLLLPKLGEVFLYFSASKVTSDCMVDCLESWWQEQRPRFPEVKRLVLNQDNGPENHSRRTQFLNRIVEFVHRQAVAVRLAYYPPYHSKYNPVERCWGVLEKHWNGQLLDTVETVLRCAKSMTWKGMHPAVKLILKVYRTGVRLTQTAMKRLEEKVQRAPALGKWFVDIIPPTTQAANLSVI